ncbi:THO complex subunit 6-like [Malus domestica]|uniref:THO complex subunit 6-like n=1 Tax=Malus domestica TaxID=3750 RepID=UPI003975DA75
MLRDFHQAQLNFLPSATKSTTRCGDATNWDEEVYRESILKEREIQTRSVWAQSLNPSPETVVVASSYGSVSSYSIPFLISKLPLGFSNVKAPQLLMAELTC